MKWKIKNLETGKEQPYNPARELGKLSVKKNPHLHGSEHMKKLNKLRTEKRKIKDHAEQN